MTNTTWVRAGRPFLLVTPLQVTPPLPTWAFKSPRRNMSSLGVLSSTLPRGSKKGQDPSISPGRVHWSLYEKIIEVSGDQFVVWPFPKDWFFLGDPTGANIAPRVNRVLKPLHQDKVLRSGIFWDIWFWDGLILDEGNFCISLSHTHIHTCAFVPCPAAGHVLFTGASAVPLLIFLVTRLLAVPSEL